MSDLFICAGCGRPIPSDAVHVEDLEFRVWHESCIDAERSRLRERKAKQRRHDRLVAHIARGRRI